MYALLQQVLNTAGTSFKRAPQIEALSVFDYASFINNGVPLLLAGHCHACFTPPPQSLPSSPHTKRDTACPSMYQDTLRSMLGDTLWGSGDLSEAFITDGRGCAPSLAIWGSKETEVLCPATVPVCGSLRMNAMIADSTGVCVWIVASSYDREKMDQLFASHGKCCHNSTHFFPLSDLAKTAFPIYIIEQREGDIVVLPPESVYQCFSAHGALVQVDWVRHNPWSLEFALTKVLPAYRQKLASPEYAIKSLCFSAYMRRLDRSESKECCSSDLIRELGVLLRLAYFITTFEWIDLVELQKLRGQGEVETVRTKRVPEANRVFCNFCKAAIFNRCYQCNLCPSSPVYLCFDCIVDGQRCEHLSSFTLLEAVDINVYQQLIQRGVNSYTQLSNGDGEGFLSSLVEQEVSSATIAFSQVQLALEDRRATCHQCKLAKPRQAMAFCSNTAAESAMAKKSRPCYKKFCSSCLGNRYMTKLSTCLKQKNWLCPHCRNICNCGSCLRKKGIDPNTYVLPFSSDRSREPKQRKRKEIARGKVIDSADIGTPTLFTPPFAPATPKVPSSPALPGSAAGSFSAKSSTCPPVVFVADSHPQNSSGSRVRQETTTTLAWGLQPIPLDIPVNSQTPFTLNSGRLVGSTVLARVGPFSNYFPAKVLSSENEGYLMVQFCETNFSVWVKSTNVVAKEPQGWAGEQKKAVNYSPDFLPIYGAAT